MHIKKKDKYIRIKKKTKSQPRYAGNQDNLQQETSPLKGKTKAPIKMVLWYNNFVYVTTHLSCPCEYKKYSLKPSCIVKTRAVTSTMQAFKKKHDARVKRAGIQRINVEHVSHSLITIIYTRNVVFKHHAHHFCWTHSSTTPSDLVMPFQATEAYCNRDRHKLAKNMRDTWSSNCNFELRITPRSRVSVAHDISSE